MNKITAIFIDSKKKTISYIEINPTLKDYYTALNCELIERFPIRLANRSFMYVDEEGAISGKKQIGIRIGLLPIFGDAIIVAEDEEGFDESTTMTIEEVSKIITFL